MSPSEHELRSALRQGEGEPVDVDRIVTAGASARARRTRLATVTASVVVVAAAAVTGVAVLGDRDTTKPSAVGGGSPRADERAVPGNPAAALPPGATSAAPSAAPSESSGSARQSQASAPDAVTCPASFPIRMLPGGGSPGQFGTDGKLFDDDVVVIVACAYGAPTGGVTTTVPGRLLITGAGATDLRTSLEAAAKRPTPVSCDAVPAASLRRFAFVGVDSSGRTGRVVTTVLSTPRCNTQTTNGTALRYAWTPPEQLRTQLSALMPDGAASVAPRPSPTGRNIGSPVR